MQKIVDFFKNLFGRPTEKREEEFIQDTPLQQEEESMCCNGTNNEYSSDEQGEEQEPKMNQ
ncbi:MAG: hypothetical protein KAI16_01750 [Candidatus Pacebacteria bacterium]|nr:hypothetical protein [Candidatus Paceibacterota bacterium]